MARKRRLRKAARALDRNEGAAWLGAAWMGLALLVMVTVVSGVYWFNPKDGPHSAVRETTGSGAGER